MLLEERAPGAPDLPRDQALAELAARFFTGHGPATEKDLAWWASLTLADVRAAIARAGDRLRGERLGAFTLWSGAEAGSIPEAGGPTPAADALRPPVVHLLQGYDELVIGYAETKALLRRPGSSWTVATPPAGRLVVLRDGRMAGSWRRTSGAGRVAVDASLIDVWDDAGREALTAAAERYAAFLDLDLSLRVAG